MKREAVRVARGEAGLSATRLWTAGDGPCELSLPKGLPTRANQVWTMGFGQYALASR